ncbi:hypothetical protein ILYODFUR_009977 [Ilyodon furcidens]|uniref:Secreted protein n=1 Tax=Ilyodon furcidens TaxID=33524 RepID=A0ABV0TV30_9TELE
MSRDITSFFSTIFLFAACQFNFNILCSQHSGSSPFLLVLSFVETLKLQTQQGLCFQLPQERLHSEITFSVFTLLFISSHYSKIIFLKENSLYLRSLILLPVSVANGFLQTPRVSLNTAALSSKDNTAMPPCANTLTETRLT